MPLPLLRVVWICQPSKSITFQRHFIALEGVVPAIIAGVILIVSVSRTLVKIKARCYSSDSNWWLLSQELLKLLRHQLIVITEGSLELLKVF